jgi:hypothetical protein
MFVIFDVLKNRKEPKKTLLVGKYCVINRQENERDKESDYSSTNRKKEHCVENKFILSHQFD